MSELEDQLKERRERFKKQEEEQQLKSIQEQEQIKSIEKGDLQQKGRDEQMSISDQIKQRINQLKQLNENKKQQAQKKKSEISSQRFEDEETKEESDEQNQTNENYQHDHHVINLITLLTIMMDCKAEIMRFTALIEYSYLLLKKIVLTQQAVTSKTASPFTQNVIDYAISLGISVKASNDQFELSCISSDVIQSTACACNAIYSQLIEFFLENETMAFSASPEIVYDALRRYILRKKDPVIKSNKFFYENKQESRESIQIQENSDDQLTEDEIKIIKRRKYYQEQQQKWKELFEKDREVGRGIMNNQDREMAGKYAKQFYQQKLNNNNNENIKEIENDIQKQIEEYRQQQKIEMSPQEKEIIAKKESKDRQEAVISIIVFAIIVARVINYFFYSDA